MTDLIRTAAHRALAFTGKNGWLALLATQSLLAQPTPARLRVSSDGHALVKEVGTPFFWLGDTAWNYFARLSASEAERYLDDRVAKRFTVIQAHLLPSMLQTRHVHGQTAFLNGDFDQPNPAYWQHVDTLMQLATQRGLYVAVAPVWCRTYVEPANGTDGPDVVLTDPGKAYRYGRFVGSRYRAYPNLIWMLGGDRLPTRHGVYRQLAQGLTDTYANGDPDQILLTYHPPGGTYRPPATSSGEFYHAEPWLDLNLIQSGHALANASYQCITDDYGRQPAKPTFDSEPCYEQHPVKHDYKNGRFTGWHVRRRAYWSVLAGAAGFTYGGNGIWQMDKPGDLLLPTHFSHFWYDALSHEAAGQMQHVRTLVETLGVGRLVPDSTHLRSPAGTVDDRVQVARDRDHAFLVAYITDGHPITLDLSGLDSKRLSGYWLDPRTGGRQPLGKFARQSARSFTPPTTGPEQDWTLVVTNPRRRLR